LQGTGPAASQTGRCPSPGRPRRPRPDPDHRALWRPEPRPPSSYTRTAGLLLSLLPFAARAASSSPAGGFQPNPCSPLWDAAEAA